MLFSINITSEFMFYIGGEMYTEKMCRSTKSFHSVMLAGQTEAIYKENGEEEVPSYWIFQNSWGEGWGMKGYAFVPKFDTNPNTGKFNDSMSCPKKKCICGG